MSKEKKDDDPGAPAPAPAPAAGRRAAAIAGLLAGAAAVCGVALLFAQASRLPWLAPSETNLAAVERCNALGRDARRQACLQDAVAAAQLRGSAQRLARNGSDAGSSPRRTQ